MKGRLPNFIKSFLEDRTIQVRVGSTVSDIYDQEQGVPQGAILSTTLFNVKLNIINCLDYKTDGALYVDDFCICFRSKNTRTIERHLQQCLNRIEDWATRNGFKFSKSKTRCVHFCQQRKINNDPALYIYGSQIPVVYRVLTWKQMSHRYGYAEKNCPFSMPSDLLLTLLILLLKSHFHQNFRNIMKENLTLLILRPSYSTTFRIY